MSSILNLLKFYDLWNFKLLQTSSLLYLPLKLAKSCTQRVRYHAFSLSGSPLPFLLASGKPNYAPTCSARMAPGSHNFQGSSVEREKYPVGLLDSHDCMKRVVNNSDSDIFFILYDSDIRYLVLQLIYVPAAGTQAYPLLECDQASISPHQLAGWKTSHNLRRGSSIRFPSRCFPSRTH